MSLSPGTRLGSYEVVAAVGAGGMGEVYRARDTRLDRTVAIKVVSASIAQDSEFRARFEREARAISQLSHPHICTLHDIGREGGVDFLVLEFLEGETLAKRLEKGPLPVEAALKMATEVCDALDRAHRHGIAHRDLKPGNVMLTKAGAKLLDFGLAKQTRGAPQTRESGSDHPTAMSPSPVTAHGTILGTFQYMSPEQIEGQDADARSDIWAFGCVLYEALTGKRAFEGRSQASLVGAIMKDEPPLVSKVQPLLPAALDRVVATCLAKDPDDRWQSAADIARELKWAMTARTEPRARSTSMAGRERVIWAAAVIGLAIVVGALLWTRSPALPASGLTTRAVLPLKPEQALVPAVLPNVAISPDGRKVAYRGGASLYVRALDELEARPLDGTEGGAYPFFSPDSQSLGFVAGSVIKRVALSGGAPVTVLAGTTTTTVRGVAWGDDGFIYYTPTVSAGLWRVPADGGTPEQLTTPDFAQGEKTHRYPFVLPGSKALLFIIGTSRITTFDDARIEALEIGTKTRRRLVEGGSYPQYVPTGHLVYSRDGALLAVPFDLDRLEVRGSPVEVVSGAFRDALYGAGQHAVSSNGTLVSLPGGTAGVMRTVAAVDRRGVAQSLAPQPALYSVGRLSPDARRLVVMISGATSQLGLVDLARGSLSRLTFEWDNEGPIWTPDGARVTFTSNRGGGPRNLYWQAADGSADAERLVKSDHEQQASAWSPDGKHLVYVETSPSSLQDVWVLSIADRKSRPLIKTPGVDGAATISPDGRWIAYHSNQSGRPEVYVQAFPSGGRRWQISTDGGGLPMWQKNGRELIYRNGTKVLAVPVTTTGEFQHGAPVTLFDSSQPLVDLMPDGRFLMLAGSPPVAITELNLVVNWFDDLRRRLGTPASPR